MEIFAKKNKHFEDVNTKYLFVADDSLFNEFKTKIEICNATKEVQLF
jgi:hypothetical protein